jgi:hypothetical protein
MFVEEGVGGRGVGVLPVGPQQEPQGDQGVEKVPRCAGMQAHAPLNALQRLRPFGEVGE